MKNYLYNMFANLKNGQLAKRKFIHNTRTKKCESFLKLLTDENFILGYRVTSNNIKIYLKYTHGHPAINSIKLISKPGRRIYYSNKELWRISSNKSFIIISTSKGLKSLVDCKKLKLGGEPILSIN